MIRSIGVFDERNDISYDKLRDVLKGFRPPKEKIFDTQVIEWFEKTYPNIDMQDIDQRNENH